MRESADKHEYDLRFLEEAVRTLRASVLTMIQRGQKVLVIASARPGEGKSTVTALLAQSIAPLRKVLVIEADLRRPRLARMLGASPGAGLSDLSPSRTLSSLIQVVNGLSFVGAGSTAADPQRIFTSAQFRSDLEAARANYELVLLDTPPVLACADATVVAPMTDGVLLLARAGAVLMSEAIETRKRFASAGASIIGGIVTGTGASDTTPYANYAEEPDPAQEPTTILAAARAVGMK